MQIKLHRGKTLASNTDNDDLRDVIWKMDAITHH